MYFRIMKALRPFIARQSTETRAESLHSISGYLYQTIPKLIYKDIINNIDLQYKQLLYARKKIIFE